MYVELLDKADRAAAMIEEARALLIQGMREAEEIYIESSEREDREKPMLYLNREE